jgi:hypothetical protein
MGRTAHADDKADCIAASDKAQDMRQQDKLVEAREQLLICVRSVCPTAISTDCGQWLKEVETSLPTASVVAKDGAGNDLIAVKVTLDGVLWLPTLDGKARSIDPGPHKLTFETPGVPLVAQEIVIREGEKARAITVTLGEHKEPPPVGPVMTTTPLPPPSQPPPSRATWLKPVGAVVGSVGLVTIATASVLGVVAALQWSNAKSTCGSSCPPGSGQNATTAYGDRDTAGTAADWSTALFIAGGVATVAGVVLFLTPSRTFASACLHRRQV